MKMHEEVIFHPMVELRRKKHIQSEIKQDFLICSRYCRLQKSPGPCWSRERLVQTRAVVSIDIRPAAG